MGRQWGIGRDVMETFEQDGSVASMVRRREKVKRIVIVAHTHL